jgi:hypothetical protein
LLAAISAVISDAPARTLAILAIWRSGDLVI